MFKVSSRREFKSIMISQKWIIRGLLLIISASAAFYFGKLLRTQKPSISHEDILSNLNQNSDLLNKTLPELVSEGVRLDTTTAGPGNSFNYFYTIIDEQTLDGMIKNENHNKYLSRQLFERVCTMMPDYRDNGTIVNYFLKNNTGKIIIKISVEPKDCDKK
jgi:hypothetical protein